eukprot:scaffold1017_cov95-Skeletonema_dohrnii-CCMP3373.AAC.1
MADHADEEDDGVNVFVYMGGRAPLHITHARIDKSVEAIEENSFNGCEHLVQVETHDGIIRVGDMAFRNCESLRRINLKSVVEIGEYAFNGCVNLESVEFGDKLEIIESDAFADCISLKHLKLPSIIAIYNFAFCCCTALTDIELSSDRLETIEARAFRDCDRLERIAIPLKRDLIIYDDVLNEYNQFDRCEHLVTVDLVGGAHTETVASLHLESWRTEMEEEINRINQVLPNTPADDKTDEIQQWMDSVINKMDYFKAEHWRYVKEAVTLLELALWKAKLDEKEDSSAEGRAKKAKIDVGSARKGKRITCGADMVIKNRPRESVSQAYLRLLAKGPVYLSNCDSSCYSFNTFDNKCAVNNLATQQQQQTRVELTTKTHIAGMNFGGVQY